MVHLWLSQKEDSRNQDAHVVGPNPTCYLYLLCEGHAVTFILGMSETDDFLHKMIHQVFGHFRLGRFTLGQTTLQSLLLQ